MTAGSPRLGRWVFMETRVMIRTGLDELAYSVMHVIVMLSCRQEVRSEVKWPRAQFPVKGELRPLRLTALVAAFERRLMPILQSFTFGNANVTINQKKKSFITIESFSSVCLPGHIWSHFLKWWTRARKCTRASTQPRMEACRV